MSDERSANPTAGYFRRYWLNWRRIRVWVLGLVLVYAVLGFAVLPWLIRDNAISIMAENYGRELRIAEIHTNPFLLSIEITGLALDDVDGESLAAFDRLLVDFTPRSLLYWAWTFQEIQLDGLTVNGERFADGQTRIGRLIEDMTPPQADDAPAPSPAEATEGGGFRLLIQEIRLNDGRLAFVDRVPPKPVSVVLDPIAIALNDLDTRPDREGSQTISVAFGDGGQLDWSGTLQLDPLRSNGRIDLQGVVLDAFLPYLQQFVDLTDFQLALNAGFNYQAGLSDGQPQVSVSNGTVQLNELSVSGFDPAVEFLSMAALNAEGITYQSDGHKARLGALRLEQPTFRTWLAPDGELALLSLLRDGEDADRDATANRQDTDTARPPVDLEIGEVRVAGLTSRFEDRSLETPAEFGVQDVDLSLDTFTTAANHTFPVDLRGSVVSGGEFRFEGELGYQPHLTIAGQATVENLGLKAAEPYVRRFARVRLEGGAFNLDGRVELGKDEPLAYKGAASVDALDVRTDDDEPILAWRGVGAEEIAISLAGKRVETSTVTVDQAAANVIIAEDRTTNIGRLLVERDGATAEPAQKGNGTDEAFDVTLGGVRLRDARLDFADRSLPLPFSTRVTALNGELSTLATGSTEPSRIDLEGQVGEYGLARIDGSLSTADPLSNTDVRMEFRNLAVPEYSPYTVQFAGRRIADGRMDLDLTYRIEQGRLDASNDIVLRDLALGEKVEGTDAPNLPLGLAVALLKDADGVIDIAVPVSGDVKDPQFAIGGVLRKAFTDLIKDLVRSPFRALGSLLGLGGEDLGRIEFLAGRSDLTPPQRESLAKLAEALRKRPQLALEVPAAYAPELDRPALQERRALEALRERLEQQSGKPSDLTLTDKAALPALRALFTEAYPVTDVDAEREAFAKANRQQGDNEDDFDEVAWQAHLARRVIAAQRVTDADLADLGAARADAVRAELFEGPAGTKPLEAKRVTALPPAPVELDDDGQNRVPLELGVDAR